MRNFFIAGIMAVVLVSFSVSFAGEKCKDRSACKQAQYEVKNSQKMSAISNQLNKISAETDQFMLLILDSQQIENTTQLQSAIENIHRNITDIKQNLSSDKDNSLSFELTEFYSEEYD